VPTTLGQFPAAALIFRKGYVKQGPAVVHEERSLADIFGRRLPMIAEEGAWDPNRDKGSMPTGTPVRAAVGPLAYLVGRVEVKYDGQASRSKVADLEKHIAKATVLDPNGMPLADVPLVKSGGGVNIALPENALYLCLEAK